MAETKLGAETAAMPKASRACILARLDRDKPDLAEWVRAGEMSAAAAAAARQARFGSPLRTPFQVIGRLFPTLTDGERDALRWLLSETRAL
jgi:hypothetical protein